jgi:hypothetical protein
MRIGSVGVLTAWLLGASSALAQVPPSATRSAAADESPLTLPITLPAAVGADIQPVPVPPKAPPDAAPTPPPPAPVVAPPPAPALAPPPAPKGAPSPVAPPPVVPVAPPPPPPFAAPPVVADPGPGPGPGCADNGACGLRCACDEPHQFFGDIEYLLWFFRRSLAPPLVQATTLPQITQASFSPLNATTLFPVDGEFRYGALPGVRYHGGMWFNDGRTAGMDGSVFYIPTKHDSINITSAGSPIIGRPIDNVGTGTPTFVALAYPGMSVGGVHVDSSTRLWGFDGGGRLQSLSVLSDRFDLLFGFRYLELKDDLTIQDTSLHVADGNSVSTFDAFHTRNQFYGAQVGGHAHYCSEKCSLDATFKMALGDMRQQAEIEGTTNASLGGLPPVTVPGGLLALPTNVGSFHHDKVVFVPELTLNLGYRLTPNMTAGVGYNLIWVTNVIRPGNAIDPGVNPGLVPFYAGAGTVLAPGTPAASRPSFSFDHAGEFFAQGLNFTLAVKF